MYTSQARYTWGNIDTSFAHLLNKRCALSGEANENSYPKAFKYINTLY